MIIADTSSIITSFEQDKLISVNDIIVPDDLYEEYLVAEIRHKKRVTNFKLASTQKGYDEAYYLKKYADVLNSYTPASLARMRGLGDVSIIALVDCIVTDYGKNPPQTMLNLGDNSLDKVIVITNDEDLSKRLSKDFQGLIDLVSYEEFIANSETSAGRNQSTSSPHRMQFATVLQP